MLPDLPLVLRLVARTGEGFRETIIYENIICDEAYENIKMAYLDLVYFFISGI